MNRAALLLTLAVCGGLLGCSSNRIAGTSLGIQPLMSLNRKQLLIENQLWDIESGKEIRQFPVPPRLTMSNGVAFGYGYVVAAAVSPDGKRVLTATDHAIEPEMSEAGPVQLWDTASGRKLWEFTPHAVMIRDVQFSPDGKRFLTALDTENNQDTVQIWDAKTGHRLLVLQDLWMPGGPPVSQNVNFSPDGRQIAILSFGKITVW